MAVRIDHDSLQVDKHLMHETLEAYVDGKIHPLLRKRVWPRIVVRGHYARSAPNVNISSTEKREKRFNWHRPTAFIVNHLILEIRCFPGRDYVQHYALLIAYYLRLNSIKATASVVEYTLPSSKACMDILLQSNLQFMGAVDTIILGYVDHLANEYHTWETGTDLPNQLFAWKYIQLADGSVVAFVGSMMSLWGDIIGDVVRTIRTKHKISNVLYLGKAGSLRSQDEPNKVLVTGESSRVDGKLLSWESPLTKTLSTMEIPDLYQGTHVTVPSPLVETEDWLTRNQKRANWVDCEVGYLAEACQENNIQFGYLHFISDNVAQKHMYSLATERQDAVISARMDIWDKVRQVLSTHLGIEDLGASIQRDLCKI
ncbi:hypothetical protein PENCOP_c001G07751 [Penicillium coprophilum]|uniref:Nucleoside phosphorylase domain-containing protein n=1 Tax=Penicillium coprophilum TaxID=36646 RepID=A0A1V6V861_9EURO|nr:hypothetical protein PENCOP_c001G07751 [Penicillium coprophilum]